MFKYLSQKFIGIVILSIFSVVTHAGIITNTATCTTTSATLDSIYISDLDISAGTGGAVEPNLLQNGPYDASSCIGLFNGNDAQVPPLDNNIGEYGDGLLNGAEFTSGPYAGNQLSGLEFINASDLQDIDGDGNATDPGWIHLGDFDAEDTEASYSSITSYDQTMTLNLSEVLQLSFSCEDGDGGGLNDCTSLSWTLATDVDIVETVQDIIGKSTFDHLAFSVKSGNENSDGGWAIYDFNFKDIFQNEIDNGNPTFDSPSAFTTAFVLGGTLDLGSDFGGKGFSHLAVWARDPADTPTDVPEPSTLGILGLALLALRFKNLKH
ncbi:PEP-CTERM sorting domain-containing protein [Thalassotalea sp. G2M2-11]|uniref:PEP-CTERM sorting domain-containing protein n=1 Tax=Thalassotalea sp. G2M2-11 TaxID=2787627 RepID=UPI0019D2DF65|nr:PEP-CTERM sorting domain-containing protein [Thalassotalea sp. G2M2-11]